MLVRIKSLRSSVEIVNDKVMSSDSHNFVKEFKVGVKHFYDGSFSHTLNEVQGM